MSDDYVGDVKPVPIKPPMTQEEVENWIMLAGQTGKVVFEIHVVDPEIDKDPTMRALLESLTEMIHNGIMGMPFLESNRPKKSKIHMAIVDAKGKPLTPPKSEGSKVDGVVYSKDETPNPAA